MFLCENKIKLPSVLLIKINYSYRYQYNIIIKCPGGSSALRIILLMLYAIKKSILKHPLQ